MPLWYYALGSAHFTEHLPGDYIAHYTANNTELQCNVMHLATAHRGSGRIAPISPAKMLPPPPLCRTVSTVYSVSLQSIVSKVLSVVCKVPFQCAVCSV